MALLGTALAGSLAPNLVHPLAPPGPGCNPYTVYGYVNETTNLGIRTTLSGVNIWVNSTFTNTPANASTFTWFTHSQPGTPWDQYQISLPCTYANGDVLTLNAYKAGSANVTVTNTSTINTASPGSHMDVLLKAPALAATLTATPPSGESPLAVVFTTTHTGGTGGYSFQWMFNDASSQLTAIGTVGHTFTDASVRWYNVTLFFNDSLGDSLAVSTVVKLVPDPSIQSFGWFAQRATSATALNNSQMVIFTTSIANGQPSYTYAYKFGINQTAQTPAATAATTVTLDHWYRGEVTGNYFPTASATTANVSVTDSQSKVAGPASSTLWVYNISAHASVHPADAGQSVSFSGFAQGGSGTYTYSWRFGDGPAAPIGTIDAAHTFAAAGTYTVNFTVNDTAHAGNSVSTTYVITINPALVAAPTGTPNPTDVGHAVVFASGASGGTSPYAYGWRYGDGQTTPSQYATPTHTFNATGAFTVREFVNDSAGFSTSGITSVVVNPDPTVSLSVENQTTLIDTLVGYVGEPLAFVASASAGTGALSCDFTYGDTHSSGATSCAGATLHAYAATGAYSATVSVTDSLGVVGTSAAYSIQIYAALTGITLATNLTHAGGEINLAVTLNAAVTGGTGVPWYHFNWSFGDGSALVQVNQLSPSPSQSHTYVRAEVVVANITVSDNQGERAYASVTFNVVPQLTATINAVASAGNLNPPVNESFSVTSSGGSGVLSTYLWTFGNGNGSAAAAPTQTYWSSGTYTVTLVITDSYGDKTGATYTFTVTGTSTYDKLVAGWNLVAMPGIDQNYNLWFVWEDLVLRGASPTTTQVSIQNHAGGMPLNYTFQGGATGSAAVAGQAIGDARGIWIYVAAAQTVGFSATTTAGPLGASTTLLAGWNNLGWVLSGSTTAALFQTNLLPSATQISYWDAATQAYVTYIVGFSNPSYDFTISNGQGILVWVPTATSFTE